VRYVLMRAFLSDCIGCNEHTAGDCYGGKEQ